MSSSTNLRTLALLSCLLTVGASGDDFCLGRLVFTPALPAQGSLPLDDPNTDFVEAADSVPGAQDRKPSRRGDGPAASWPTSSRSPRASRAPLLAHAVGPCFPLVGLNIPLLC
jgi:hypothetical protein